MKTILLIGTIEAIFLILLILGKRNRRLPDMFLGFIFLSYAMSIGFTYLELLNAEKGYPWSFAMNISWIFLFLHGPALWFYIRSLSVKGFRFRWIYLFHFIPFLAFFTIQYITFISLNHEEKIHLVESDLFQQQFFYHVSVMGIAVSTITYYIWGLLQIRQRRRRLMQHFSKIENRDLSWLRILIIVSLIVYGVNVSLFNLDLIFDFAPYNILMLGAYSFASVYIFVLGWFGLRQGNVFISPVSSAFEPDSKESEVSPGDRNVDDGLTAYSARIADHMDKVRPFLDPELTLQKLSDQLTLSPDVVSRVLNKHFDQSFFDFINKYRVEEFKVQSMLSENKHLSIIGIAYNCGFNSKAAFYRAFRRYENCSPSEFMSRIQ